MTSRVVTFLVVWLFAATAAAQVANPGDPSLSPFVRKSEGGSIKFPAFATGAEPVTCNAANAGKVVYNTTGNLLRFCNGSAWTNVGTGSPAFSALASGTNTSAAMVVGNGSSLAATGTGTITATALPFSGLSGATNTTAAMVVGTGGSLTVSGSGTINATTLLGATWAAPAAIGTGTPAAGTFTALTDSALTSGRVTFASTGGLLADSSSFTFDGSTLSVPTLSLATTPLAETSGGTGTSTTAGGDLLYGGPGNTWLRLPISTDGKVLTLSGGVPSWQVPAGGGPWTDGGSHVYTTASETVTVGDTSAGATVRVVQAAASSGAAAGALTVTGGAHTGQTASTELIDVDLALNRTVQRAAGAVTTQRAVYMRAPTYSFVGASTITTASTLAISGAPTAGTNATISYSNALHVESGVSRFGGNVILLGSLLVGDTVAAAMHWYGASNSSVLIGTRINVNTYGGDYNLYAGVTSGSNATAGSSNTAVGYNSGQLIVNGTENTLIGRSANVNDPSVSQITAVGAYALGGSVGTAAGRSATATGGYSSAFGAFASSTHNSSLALGYYATTTAANQLVIGGNNSGSGNITDGYIGSGVTKATPSAVTLQTTGGSGTNNAGANFTIAAGKSTGNAAPAKLYFQTSTATGSGSTLQTLATRLTVDVNAVTAGTGVFLDRSVTAGITASTTQTQGQGALTSEVNEISTCANPNDTVTLPAAAAGRHVLVINNGASTLQVFPASGDDLGAGVDTATTIATGSRKYFVAFDATNWEPVI